MNILRNNVLMPINEKVYLELISSFGCIACLLLGYGHSKPVIHHPRCLVGGAQRSGHFVGIPLCPAHHTTGGYGVAIHAGQKEFEKNICTEQQLLAITFEMVFCQLSGRPHALLEM